MRRVGQLLLFVVVLLVLFVNVKNVSAANIDNCSVLGVAGETYVLTADILDSPETACMNITADNVTLDCGGNNIDGVYSASTYGIDVKGNGNFTVKNCNLTDWWYGVRASYVSNATIFKNNFTDNNVDIGMYDSWYNNISRNLQESSQTGIYFDNCSYNSIGHNSIKNANYGLAFYSQSNSNTHFGNIFETFSSYAVYLFQSRYNFFRDSFINTTTINVYNFASGDTIFVNVSLDKSKITVDTGAVYVKWYLDARVLTTEASPVEQANVTVNDKDKTTVFSELTDSLGYIPGKNVTEFHQNFSGKFFYNNYTINVTRFGFLPNNVSVNVTTNKLVTITLTRISPPEIELKTYDMGLAEKDIFRPGTTVRIRATVTYVLGKEYISNSTILIKNNLGQTVVNNQLMTNVSEMANGYIYEYNYTTPGDAGGLWQINVTSTDSLEGKSRDSKKIAIIPLNFQIKMILNSTSDKIYIPGTGELAFSSLTTNEYSTPEHYYIASYSNNSLKSVVSSSMNSLSLLTDKGSNVFGVGTSQRFSGSLVFLVFTRGDWRNVNNRISSIENGEFLSYTKPSFGFGLGKAFKLKLILEYDNIDINRTLTLGRGYNKLVIEKGGMSGGKANIVISRV